MLIRTSEDSNLSYLVPSLVRFNIMSFLVRTLPDGVYFTSVKMTGKDIAIVGAAESNNRVSNLMRNLDASEWLTAPNLTEVKAVTAGAVPGVQQISRRAGKPLP